MTGNRESHRNRATKRMVSGTEDQGTVVLKNRLDMKAEPVS